MKIENIGSIAIQGHLQRINDCIGIEWRDSIALVRLMRSDKHNAVNEQVLYGIQRAQKEIKKNKSVRAVVLVGEGPSFCSGLDFKSIMKTPLVAARLYAKLYWPFRNLFQDWSLGWRDLGVPVIAAVHGNCFGAGLQLALGADFRVVHPEAKLSLMEIKWGLVPDMGGPTLLRELVRIDVAKDLTMTGRVFSGLDAQNLGLATRMDENPVIGALKFAEELADKSPDALRVGKQMIQKAWLGSEFSALRQERVGQRRIMGFPAQRQAMQKNLSKK